MLNSYKERVSSLCTELDVLIEKVCSGCSSHRGWIFPGLEIRLWCLSLLGIIECYVGWSQVYLSSSREEGTDLPYMEHVELFRKQVFGAVVVAQW